MKRRSFIQMASGASIAFSLFNNNAFPFSAIETQNTDMFIDKNKLANRNQNRSTVVCQNGIVCTAQPLASQAAIDILKSGGNAIDAAICASALLSVVEPMMCGPGGDLFAIVWIEKEKKLYGLNAGGRSPYNWNLDKIKEMGLSQIPTFGPLSWSVPGCISGWDKLAQKFGNKKPGELLASAVHYAENGFPVSPIIAGNWHSANNKEYPTLASTFAPNDKTPAFGDIFKNKDIANFYKILSRDGFGAFYKGEIADRIVKFSRQQGGLFDKKDFANHTANWVEPVSANYRGYDVWELPPNGQGIAAL